MRDRSILWLMDDTFRFRHPWPFSLIMATGAAIAISGLFAMDGSYGKILPGALAVFGLTFFAVRLGVVYEGNRDQFELFRRD